MSPFIELVVPKQGQMLDDQVKAARARAWISSKGGARALGEDTLTYVEILLNDPCSYCGRVHRDRQIDHIHPPKQGGSHHYSNLTAACANCNQEKRGRSLLTMVARMGYSEITRRENDRLDRLIAAAAALQPEIGQAVHDARAAVVELEGPFFAAQRRYQDAVERWNRFVDEVIA